MGAGGVEGRKGIDHPGGDSGQRNEGPPAGGVWNEETIYIQDAIRVKVNSETVGTVKIVKAVVPQLELEPGTENLNFSGGKCLGYNE